MTSSSAPAASPLTAVNFHLIKACNEDCRYCFATFRDVDGHLSDDEAEELVRLLARHGLQKLTFVGGEPTLHKALPRLLRTAHGLGVTTMVVSNGARLDAVLDEAADAIDWVGLSIDSAREDVQQRLRRGHGDYVARSERLFGRLRALGLKTKLNTVVTALNWEEDMSDLIRRLRPDRWKAFQVLPIAGQNDGSVEPLLISREHFRAFIDRHAPLAAEGLAPVAEDNEAMTGSYLMIDPLGRFYDNVEGRLRYSRPILEVGVEAALLAIRFSVPLLQLRGGLYDWSAARSARPAPPRGVIIAIEGLDGSGKSTTVRALATRLDAAIVRNPPQSLAAERARADALPPEERRRWYLNANRVAMEEALAVARRGRAVVLDRSVASTVAFGAAERGAVADRSGIPDDFPLPDHIVLLSVPEKLRQQRHMGRGDVPTGEESRLAVDHAFRERVLAGYRRLCSAEVDASGETMEIVTAVLARCS